MEYPQEKVRPKGYGDGSKREQVELMFDHIAPTYDRLNHTMSMGIDRRWRKKAIRALQPYAPQQMLDVATGTGDFALQACCMLHPVQLVGIDISEGMMQVGREKVKAAGLEQVIRFEQQDCTQLSFADETFDAVTVAFGIRNFEHLDRGLSEMWRVLRKGGHLVILELSAPERFPMKQLYRLYAGGFIPLVGRLISRDRSAYTYLPESIQAFPQGEVMQQVIRKAGFTKVNFKRLTFGVCTLYMAEK